VAEAGVKGFEVTQWYAFFAPAKTPKAIVDKLNAEVVAVMKDPDTFKRFAEQGAEAETSTPEELGKFVEAEIAKWKKVISAAKITAD
jgi:tripartite-type tricarboxylate transporter receptor subunit TctC